MLHLERSFVWCWNLDTSERRWGIPEKFWNVVQQKGGEDHLDWSCAKWRSVTRVKWERNILHAINKRRANWIGHNLRKNWLLKHVIEGKIEKWVEVRVRWGGRSKLLLDDLKEKRGYWKFKGEVLHGTVWLWKGLWTCRKATKWIKTTKVRQKILSCIIE